MIGRHEYRAGLVAVVVIALVAVVLCLVQLGAWK